MNKRLAYKSVETKSSRGDNYLEITTRVKHSRIYRHTIIDLKNVSQHWLNIYDMLQVFSDILYVHHFNWGFVVCRTREIKKS